MFQCVGTTIAHGNHVCNAASKKSVVAGHYRSWIEKPQLQKWQLFFAGLYLGGGEKELICPRSGRKLKNWHQTCNVHARPCTHFGGPPMLLPNFHMHVGASADTKNWCHCNQFFKMWPPFCYRKLGHYIWRVTWASQNIPTILEKSLLHLNSTSSQMVFNCL